MTAVKRLKEGEVSAIEDSYIYNGDGLRVSQTINGATVYLSWNYTEKLPLLLANGTHSYIFGLGESPIEQVSPEGTQQYLHHDQQGSTRLITSASGAKVENIDATYELLGRGAYSSSNTKIDNAIFGIDRKTPLELFEARNALRVAHNANAEKYAPAAWAKAQQQLAAAEETYRQKRDRKLIDSASRDATETAEESRVMAVKQKGEEDAQAKIAAEKQAAEQPCHAACGQVSGKTNPRSAQE